MEENNDVGYEIVFPVDSMVKKAYRDCARIVFGSIGSFIAITVVGKLLGVLPIYFIVLQFVLPFAAVGGVFCWFISLYNSTRVLSNIKATEEGFFINKDSYGFDGLNMNFVHGKFFGKVRKFNSMYLDVRAPGVKRKYWMGLYKDKTAYIIRDRLGKLIDHYEFDKELINQR